MTTHGRSIRGRRTDRRAGGYERDGLASVLHLPFRPNTFAAVLCTSVLHYVNRVDTALAEIHRVLRPGGRTVIGDFERAGPQPNLAQTVTAASLTLTGQQRYDTPLGGYLVLTAQRPE